MVAIDPLLQPLSDSIPPCPSTPPSAVLLPLPMLFIASISSWQAKLVTWEAAVTAEVQAVGDGH